MNFSLGVSKEMKQVLTERGVNTRGMNSIKMRQVLEAMSDFVKEKSQIEHYLEDKGHICVFLPKFHPKLNPIEHV